jgi:hypothetical protein
LAADALKLIVTALDGHREHLAMQREGCHAIFVIALRHADSTLHANRCGAISAICAALQAHPTNAKMQAYGVNALGVMCDDNAENAAHAGALGAYNSIVSASRAHLCDANLQVGCMFAVRTMTMTNAARTKAGAAGAVEAVVAVMRAHPADADLQRTACQTFAALVCGSVRHASNLQRACAAGGIEAIVTSGLLAAGRMQNMDLFRDAFCLLSHFIAGSKPNIARAMRAGALEALLAGDHIEMDNEDRRHIRAILIRELRAAAAQHDADGACVRADCMRCAGMRARGDMCALPGCCARKRAGGGNKKLLRCGSCDSAWYCGAPHQREDWARHREACRARRAGMEEEEESDDDDA